MPYHNAGFGFQMPFHRRNVQIVNLKKLNFAFIVVYRLIYCEHSQDVWSTWKSGLHFLIILYFVFKKAVKLGDMVICFLTIYLMSSLFLSVKGKTKWLYCFIEGVSLFTFYLFLSLFNEGDYFEKPGIMDDYRNSPTIKFCSGLNSVLTYSLFIDARCPSIKLF